MKSCYLKSIRERQGLSIRQLSEMSGISHDFLARYERNERTLSRKVLLKVAQALEIDSDEVLIAHGYLPHYTEVARIKNPNKLNVFIKKATKKILNQGEF